MDDPTPAEVARVRYIVYDYWDKPSGGTRLAVDAAAGIRVGVTPFVMPNDGCSPWRRLSPPGPGSRCGSLVTTRVGGDDLVVLENHVRPTAFVHARDQLPTELEVLAGSSLTMTKWGSPCRFRG